MIATIRLTAASAIRGGMPVGLKLSRVRPRFKRIVSSARKKVETSARLLPDKYQRPIAVVKHKVAVRQGENRRTAFANNSDYFEHVVATAIGAATK